MICCLKNRIYLTSAEFAKLDYRGVNNIPCHCLKLSGYFYAHGYLDFSIGDEFKIHFVSWSKICSPMSYGGLGVRNLVQFNCALLENCCGGILQRGMLY